MTEETAFNHGSVVSLKLKDFMQFRYVECHPGPSLNVIIGPNGSGKSSIVNGIALALGAKTAVLGRATHVVDFIRIGCETAYLEIELFNAQNGGQQNYVIQREINKLQEGNQEKRHTGVAMERHSQWKIDGEAVKLKDVAKLAFSLNIQTDNLCQFLPQDKVHDFSKMSPKELLKKTVEAIGDQELKEDHTRLKELQCKSQEDGTKKKRKENTLESLKTKRTELEQDVKNFETKEKIQEKIKLLEKRHLWAIYEENIEKVKHQENIVTDIQNKRQDCKERKDPIDKNLKAVSNERSKREMKIIELNKKYNVGTNKALKCTMENEELRDKLGDIESDYKTMVEKEEARKVELAKIQKELETMRREYKEALERQGEKSEVLEAKVRAAEKEMERVNSEKDKFEERLREMTYESKSLEGQLQATLREEQRLLNTKNAKIETLQKNFQNSQDTLKAMKWLENNRDQFAGHVYDPLLICIDVQDAAQNAKYLECVIPVRDLQAFAAENAEDANELMRQFRDKMKLRVNVVQVDPNPDMNRCQPRGGGGYQNHQDLIGYLSNMISCPDPIKAYLCKLYQLHQIPVFNARAERQVKTLVENETRLFFVGDVRYSVIKSNYSSATSTSSISISDRNLLKISLDKAKLQNVEDTKAKIESRLNGLNAEINERKVDHKSLAQDLEAKKKEVKYAREKLHEKRVLKGRLDAKEQLVQDRLKTSRPVDLKKAHSTMLLKKKKTAQDVLVNCNNLKDDITEMFQTMARVKMTKFSLYPVKSRERRLKEDASEINEEWQTLTAEYNEEFENLRVKKIQLHNELSKAQESVGQPGFEGRKPPKFLVKKWIEESIDKLDAEEANVQAHLCEGQLECLDDVDPKKVEDYRIIKDDIQHLETELSDWEENLKEHQKLIETISIRFVTKLQTMVDAIDAHFSVLLEYLGFAGNVILDKGKHQEDFTNFGFDVMVKFRDKLNLQRLDPFKQSGGERSVTTAIYMMAMQSITKVPFRCVDEINQGMDERNERKVFDLIIETAVRANTAQYFLLTPKLLSDLKYERGVRVHFVHSGTKMNCSSKKWNLKRFMSVARRNQKAQKSH